MITRITKTIFIALVLIGNSISTFGQRRQDFPQHDPAVANNSSQDIVYYDIKVYQNPQIADIIREKWETQTQALKGGDANRGFLSDIWGVTQNNAFGMISTGITGLISTGINSVGNLLKSKKGEWQMIVQRENIFEKTLFMLENLDDFYSAVSVAGALDPSSMSFNGFGCLQKRGNDTILYISCHLDTTEVAFSRILRHSKFELMLDTLVFNPQKCDLPNDSTLRFSERKPFSFTERKDLNLRIDVNITSSWINQAIQIYNDQVLGNFHIQVPINEESLDSDSVFRYYRGVGGHKEGCEMIGNSFIVPRSYIGVRDNDGIFHDAWGTGQYKLSVTIKETCNITPSFEKNWKADWKRRKQQQHKPFNLIQTIKQSWDKNAGQWVVTILEAPAHYAAQELMQSIGVTDQKQQSTGGTVKGGTQGGALNGAQGEMQGGAHAQKKNTIPL